jgi:hypothetical protein
MERLPNAQFLILGAAHVVAVDAIAGTFGKVHSDFGVAKIDTEQSPRSADHRISETEGAKSAGARIHADLVADWRVCYLHTDKDVVELGIDACWEAASARITGRCWRNRNPPAAPSKLIGGLTES